MSMNEPRMPRDPNIPQRNPYVRDAENTGNVMGWVFGAIAAVLVLGFVIWSFSDRLNMTANNPAPTTTGQGTPARPTTRVIPQPGQPGQPTQKRPEQPAPQQ